MLKPRYLQSINNELNMYIGWIIDIWGVIHNGVKLFPSVLSFFTYLKESQKKIILLSNAPRRVSIAKNRLAEMGLTPDYYDGLYTSGEDCYEHLKHIVDPFYQRLGDRFYHIGPQRDQTLFQDLKHIKRVNHLQEASFLLITGTWQFEDTLDAYIPLLKTAFLHNLLCICANADQIVIYGDKEVIAAGTLAKYYEALGGEVRYHGKPHAEIYDSVLQKLALPKDQLIIIGDALATDIQGAFTQGVDSILIMNGIHRSNFLTKEGYLIDDPELRFEYLKNPTQIIPTYLAKDLESLIPPY